MGDIIGISTVTERQGATTMMVMKSSSTKIMEIQFGNSASGSVKGEGGSKCK